MSDQKQNNDYNELLVTNAVTTKKKKKKEEKKTKSLCARKQALMKPPHANNKKNSSHRYANEEMNVTSNVYSSSKEREEFRWETVQRSFKKLCDLNVDIGKDEFEKEVGVLFICVPGRVWKINDGEDEDDDEEEEEEDEEGDDEEEGDKYDEQSSLIRKNMIKVVKKDCQKFAKEVINRVVFGAEWRELDISKPQEKWEWSKFNLDPLEAMTEEDYEEDVNSREVHAKARWDPRWDLKERRQWLESFNRVVTNFRNTTHKKIPLHSAFRDDGIFRKAVEAATSKFPNPLRGSEKIFPSYEPPTVPHNEMVQIVIEGSEEVTDTEEEEVVDTEEETEEDESKLPRSSRKRQQNYFENLQQKATTQKVNQRTPLPLILKRNLAQKEGKRKRRKIFDYGNDYEHRKEVGFTKTQTGALGSRRDNNENATALRQTRLASVDREKSKSSSSILDDGCDNVVLNKHNRTQSKARKTVGNTKNYVPESDEELPSSSRSSDFDKKKKKNTISAAKGDVATVARKTAPLKATLSDSISFSDEEEEEEALIGITLDDLTIGQFVEVDSGDPNYPWFGEIAKVHKKETLKNESINVKWVAKISNGKYEYQGGRDDIFLYNIKACGIRIVMNK